MSLAQQDLDIERDRARLLRKAEVNVVRNLRLRDSRWRTIGIEEQALREQVAEKNRAKQAEIEEGRMDRIRNEEYDRILQAAADEEAYLRQLQNDELRRSWEESAKAKKNVPQTEIDNSSQGISQTIGQEDLFLNDRVKAQKDQMRRWVEEQAAANRSRKNREKDEDNAYADMIKAVDEIRSQAELEEAALRKKLLDDVRRENAAVKIRYDQIFLIL